VVPTYRPHSSHGIFFFFQAEDGIRGLIVTGVQTCALPISLPARARQSPLSPFRAGRVRPANRTRPPRRAPAAGRPSGVAAGCPRSEERRVGKECRGGGGA